MIRQLIYLSIERHAGGYDDFARMVETARRANEAAQVTGLLAVGGGIFFHVLEGPRDNVEAAFVRLSRDPRHTGIRILQDEMCSSRDFAGWPLALRQMDAGTAMTVADSAESGEDAVSRLIAALDMPLAGLTGQRLSIAA
jgi:hypothetical protein